jgi:hypothetical protein
VLPLVTFKVYSSSNSLVVTLALPVAHVVCASIHISLHVDTVYAEKYAGQLLLREVAACAPAVLLITMLNLRCFTYYIYVYTGCLGGSSLAALALACCLYYNHITLSAAASAADSSSRLCVANCYNTTDQLQQRAAAIAATAAATCCSVVAVSSRSA